MSVDNVATPPPATSKARSIYTRVARPQSTAPEPYSRHINVSFRGGSPPQVNRDLHAKYSRMAERNPQKLRNRARADIRYMKRHKLQPF